MASTKPSMSDVLNDLRNQNANLPTEKKQNIIVVQDTGAGSDDKTGQMLTVLNSIFNAVSEQLRLTRESLNLQKQDRLEAKDFQKEAMDVSSGKYEPPEYSSGGGGGTASSAGEGGGIADTVGKVGGGLWEGVKGVGKAITGVAARHPIGTAIGVGAAAGGAFHYAENIKSNKDKDKRTVQVYDAYRSAGLSDKQARAITAEVGRENEFNPDTLFGLHTDEANRATNIGMLSWQGDRATKLRKYLSEKGLLTKEGKIQRTQESLNAMAEFSVSEMKNMKSGQMFLNNPNIGSEEAAELMGGRKGIVGWAMHQTRLRSGKPFDWEAHNRRRKGHYERLSGLLQGQNLEKNNTDKSNTATKLTSNGEQAEPQRINSVIRQQQKGATRSLSITDTLDQKLSEAIQAVYGEGYTGSVYSGGQHSHGGKRTGTHRHDEGHAADLRVYDSKGKLISGDKLAPLAQYWRAMGYGGIGLEMGKGGIHLDERKEEFLRKFGGKYDWSYGTRTKEQLAAIKAGEKGIMPQLAKPELAGITQGQTRLASNEEQLPKSGRHQLERTDEKSSVLQASMFAPLQTAFDRMTNVLEKIAGNTKDTKDEMKASRTEDKESPSATKTDEEPTKTYKPTDYLSEEDKKKYDEAEKKALNESLKTGKKEITEDDVMKHLSDADKAKFNKAKEDAKAASLAESNATRMEPEKDLNDALANLPKGEGSDVMRMLFGQGGAIMGSAEPIEPGSPKRKFLDSLPTYNDELWEYVKKLLTEGGEISEEDMQGALQTIGEADTSGVMGGLLGMGNGSATPQGTGDQLKNIGVTPMSGSEQFLNNLGITPYNNQQENRLTTQKENQLSNMGVTGFGDVLKTFGGSNNPFFSMQNVLGQVGSMANMGQNIGGMMQQGGLGAIQGVMGQMGGVLSGMGQGFPMMQGIGGMLGQAGNMIGTIRGFENIGRGGNGVMGGIGAASSVLGSLGNVFGGMQRMGGGLSGMGVTPFGQGQGMLGGLGSMVSNIGNIAGGGIGQGINAASGIMGAAGGLMNTATSLGSSVGGMFGGIGDSLGGLFGGSNSVSSKGIGDDAASISSKYSDLIMNQTGQNLDSLQSSNDSLSSMPSGSSGGSSNQSSGMPGRNASAPADTGSMGSSMGASGGAGFKSGDKRAGSSAGAMGNSINPYNNCNVLYQWLYRNMWWAKV